jgi:outer membrane protein
MKNLSIILNVILLVAVVVLYVLFFTSGKKPNGVSSRNDTTNLDLKIAYINSDTVLKYYDYLKVNKDQLEAKTTKLKQDFRQRAIGLDSEIKAYQRNVSSMTLGQVRAAEEDLAKKQQNLQMYEQTLSQQIMEEEARLNKELYDRVTTYLKEYGSEKGLQLVLKYDPTSDVLYGTSGIDITQDVIAGLNQAYQTEQNGPAAKSDTTKAR